MQKRCVLVNQDSQDGDVVINLMLFYESCGYEVTMTTEPKPADLVVIQRAFRRESDPPVRIEEADLHVYDYSKMPNGHYARSLTGVDRYHLITLDRTADDPRAQLVAGNHPVMTGLWVPAGDLGPVRYPGVHIGNLKESVRSDPLQASFERYAARSPGCHFFGGGWHLVPGVDERGHGHITLHESQSVYRSSGCGFGIMYPYQRQQALSGRMWQGPLNGCPIYTEALPPDLALPGVVRTHDYSEMLHLPPPLSHAERHDLVSRAQKYWDQDAARIAAGLGLELRPAPTGRVASLYRKHVVAHHARLKLRRQLSRVKQALIS